MSNSNESSSSLPSATNDDENNLKLPLHLAHNDVQSEGSTR